MKVVIKVVEYKELHAYGYEAEGLRDLDQVSAREKVEAKRGQLFFVDYEQQSGHKFGHMREKVDGTIGDDHFVEFLLVLEGFTQMECVFDELSLLFDNFVREFY